MISRYGHKGTASPVAAHEAASTFACSTDYLLVSATKEAVTHSLPSDALIAALSAKTRKIRCGRSSAFSSSPLPLRDSDGRILGSGTVQCRPPHSHSSGLKGRTEKGTRCGSNHE